MSDPISPAPPAAPTTVEPTPEPTTVTSTDPIATAPKPESNGFHFGVSAEYQHDKAGLGWVEEGQDQPSSNDHQINGFGLNGQIGYEVPLNNNGLSLDLSASAGYNWGSNAIDSFEPLTIDVAPEDEALFRYMNRTETGSRNFELTFNPRLGYQVNNNVQVLGGVFGSYRLYSKEGPNSAVTTWSDAYGADGLETQGLVQRTSGYVVGPEIAGRIFAGPVSFELYTRIGFGNSSAIDNDSVAAGNPQTFGLPGTDVIGNVGLTMSLFPKRLDNDWDDDQLLNSEENQYGTDPRNPDTDGDELTDYREVKETNTNPTNPDSDADGLTDGQEVLRTLTDPNKADTDEDGLTDGEEINTYYTSPLVSDTDGDGLKDGEEVKSYRTSPAKADTDGDSVSDGVEITQSIDAAANPNIGTVPANPLDSDGDGTINPLDADDDGDGIETLREAKTDGEQFGLDVDGDGIPNNIDLDSDSDGRADKDEGVNISNMRMGVPDYLNPNGKIVISNSRIYFDGDIKFDTGKYTIKRESYPILDAIAAKIIAEISNPALGKVTKIEIQGHADPVGDETSNQILSQGRAQAVVTYLEQKGVPTGVLVAVGKGESTPFVDPQGKIYDTRPDGTSIAPGSTATGTVSGFNTLNRRVEIHVTRENKVVISGPGVGQATPAATSPTR